MVDLATLSITIDSSSAKTAVADLNSLTVAATKTEASTRKLEKTATGIFPTDNIVDFKKKLHETAKDVDSLALKTNNASKQMAGGIGLARHEMINFSRQVQDVGVSLYSGQSPFTVLVQQGAQIGDIFGTTNGTMKGFVGQITSMITPARLLAGVLASVAATATAAMFAYRDSQKELSLSLTGMGRGSGQTLDSLNKISASAKDLSTFAAREVAGTFAATGKIGPEILDRLVNSTNTFGLMTGQDPAEAAKQLAGMFADPIKGADKLNERFGFMSDKMREYIRNSVAMGDRNSAQKALMDALNSSLSENQIKLSIWVHAWNGVSNAINKVGEAIEFAVSPTKLQKLDRLNRDVALLSKLPMGGFGQLAGATQQRDELARSIRNDRETASDRADMIKSRETSRVGGDIVRKYSPAILERQGLQNDMGALEKLRDNAAAMSLLGVSAEEVTSVLARLKTGFNLFQTATDKAREDGALQVKTIEAYTYQQRTDVEATRARIEATRALKDITLVATEAENVRARALAESNRQLRDVTRDVQDRASLVGLTGLQRSQRERENSYRRMQQTNDPDYVYNPVEGGSPANDNNRRVTLGAVGSGTNYRTAGGHVDTANLNSTFESYLKKLMDGFQGVIITSAHRSEKYNASIGGVSGSNHINGTAADLGGTSVSAVQARIDQLGLPLRVIPSNGGAVHVDMGHVGGSVPNIPRIGAVTAQGAVGAQGAVTGPYGSLLAQDNATAQSEAAFNLTNDATNRIKEQAAAADLLTSSIGKSTAAMAADAEVQRLRMQAAQQGITMNDGLASSFNLLGQQAGEAAEKQRQAGETVRQVSDWNSTLADGVKGLASAFIQGKNMAEAFRNTLLRFADKAIGSVIDSLFGAGGTQGGLLGRLLGGGLFSGGGGLPKAGAIFANGGIMSSQGALPLNRYAGGGIANSPQMAIFGDGRGPEAYVPLPDGRSIPVTMRGRAANNNKSGSFTINAPSNITITGDANQQAIHDLRASQIEHRRAIAKMAREMQSSSHMQETGVSYGQVA